MKLHLITLAAMGHPRGAVALVFAVSTKFPAAEFALGCVGIVIGSCCIIHRSVALLRA